MYLGEDLTFDVTCTLAGKFLPMLLPDLPQRNKHGSPVDEASNGKFLKLGINIYVSRFERGIL